MEHLSHLEAAYLFHFVPRFSYSLRKQMVNPGKVYAADTDRFDKNGLSANVLPAYKYLGRKLPDN